jgi:hypothetical protein
MAMNDPGGPDPFDHISAGGIPQAVLSSRLLGLALQFRRDAFLIQVCGSDEAERLDLGPFDYEEVVAVWRRLAASSGLPLLLPGPDGVLQQPYPQIGRLLVGPVTERRKAAVLNGRRPRFLTKRRASRLPRRPRIHRETEIAAGRSL